MTRTRLILAMVILLLATAHRLPAPISEENSTPAPEKSAKPRPRRIAKPDAESSSTTRPRPKPAAAATPIQNPFDGIWIGTINNIGWIGNVDFTLFVSGGGTAVTEKSQNFGTNNFQTTSTGSTIKWETGASWTLTPNPDGKTALVTCNGAGFFGVGAVSAVGVFQRTSTAVAQTSAPAVTNTSGPAPVAKPVHDRPGFVYNPFDPNSRILLDVRGKASGTKLIEPRSGKMFIVP